MQKADEITLIKYVTGRVLQARNFGIVKNKKTANINVKQMVIGDVVAHLKQQKITFLLDL